LWRRSGRQGAFGFGVLLPLVLVVGLMVFNTVDADGDPLTANGPAVVLITESPGAEAREDDAERTDSEAEGGEPRRLCRSVAGFLRRVRSARFPLTRPIRGP